MRYTIDPAWKPAHERAYLRYAEFTRPGSSFPDIVFGRNKDGAELAMKALAIVVPTETAIQFEGLTDLGAIVMQLADIADRAKMVLIHQDRPITHLPFLDDNTSTGLRHNVQVELSGGIQEPGQNAKLTARRELLEEAGVGNVLCSVPFYHGYLANSAGHQHERYGMELIIAVDLPKPTESQKEEGIVTAYAIPILEVSDHLDDLSYKGYLIEWAAYLAIGRLESKIMAAVFKKLSATV